MNKDKKNKISRKEVEELREEFISVVAHELRTPVTLARGYISMVLESPDEKLTKHGRYSLKTALLGIDRLIDMVNDFMGMIELEDEGVVITPLNCSVTKFINPIYEKYFPYAKEKGINLVFKRSKTNNLPKVRVNYKLMKQVIKHLVENALKFTEKGKIEINAKTIKEKNKDKEILISVSDTGVGISHDKQKIIFEKNSLTIQRILL